MADAPRLLDQYGQPIKRAELTREQARPSLTSIRQVWTPSVASGLTPERLASLLISATEGDAQDYLVLAEEMEERDLHYASVLGVRKRAVSGVQPIVTPGGEDAKAEEIAEAVRERIAEQDHFPDLVEDLMDAVGKGYACIEIDWQRDAAEWWPRGFQWRDPRWFVFDRETLSDIRLLTDAEPVEGEALAPYKWMVHRPRVKSGLTLRGGLARLIAFAWLIKAYGVKDWIAFIETYGLPLRLGRYGPGATDDDVRVLYTAVANIGTDAAAVLPESMNIDFEALTGGVGNDIFEKLARWVDEQISKGVLGQTMTADDGASLSQAQVHDSVRHDILKADCRQIEGCINRDLVRLFVDLNFGPQEVYPKLEIPVQEPEDVAAIIQNVERAARMGVRFRAAEIREKLGFTKPEKEDEADEIIGALPIAPPPPDPAALARALNMQRQDVYDPLDAVELQAALDWQGQLGPIVDPILRLAEEAGSYEAFRDRLPDLLGEMATAELIDGLTAALFQARAEGDTARA